MLLSDLFEGGDRAALLGLARELVESGVNLVVLLALDDDGAPWFEHDIAGAMAALGATCFACTPDRFAPMMATALSRRDVAAWCARENIVTISGAR